MRFKPRTDLERITDTIKEYNYSKINEKEIRQKLEAKRKNVVTQSSSSEENNSFDEFKLKHDNNFEEKRLMIDSLGGGNTIINFRKIDSSVAKELMSEYYNKTHFKAAMSLADNYPKIIKRNEKKSKNNSVLNEKICSSMKSLNRTGYINNQYLPKKKEIKNNTFSILEQFVKRFPLLEENLDLVEANPLMYNHSFKENINQKSIHDFTQEQMDVLKDLALNSSNNQFIRKMNKSRNETRKAIDEISKVNSIKEKISNKKNESHRELLHKEIIIDNEIIAKSQIELIAKKILKKCNYSHSKSPNNNTSLKKGEGKLMITSGMTVNNFFHKYNLK